MKYLQKIKVILSVNYTKHGYLKHKYTRPDLIPSRDILLDVTKIIEEKKLTRREIAGLCSISGIQDYQKCFCKTKRKNSKYACHSLGYFFTFTILTGKLHKLLYFFIHRNIRVCYTYM